MTPREFKDAAQAGEILATCTLCGAPRNFVGVFFPNNTPGKAVGYALCEACMNLPNKVDLIEKQIALLDTLRN